MDKTVDEYAKEEIKKEAAKYKMLILGWITGIATSVFFYFVFVMIK